MTHVLKDLNRRDLNLATSKVKEVLPEYYTQDNANLITFLEKYYDYLDSSTTTSFKTEIDNLFSIRDISQTENKYLDQLISEIGNGLQVASFFNEPRLMTRLLSQFYRAKGSLVSIEGFFRAFFNSEVDIEYPKEQIFIVGQSEIGPESLRFIINNELYQTFSILIKSGVSVADYQELYKRFVHPAGFYFAGQVAIETQFDLDLEETPGIEDPTAVFETGLSLVGQGETALIGEFEQLTGLYESDGQAIRISLDEVLSEYGGVTAPVISTIYDNFADLLNPNSFTFDDSAQQYVHSLHQRFFVLI